VTLLPESPKLAIAGHLEEARRRHEKGVASGFGSIYHPVVLGRKTPVAATAGKRQDDSPPPAHPADLGPERRGDADDNPVSRAATKAASGSRSGRQAMAAGTVSRPTPSEASDDPRTTRELLGHDDASTSTIGTHALNRDGAGARRPPGG